MKPHWYLTIVTECPVCGRGDVARIRMYTPRPIDATDRFQYTIYYDHCDDM